MNILVVTSVFVPEPVVSSLLSEDIAMKLSDGNKVTVLCPKPSRPYKFDFSNQIMDFSNKPYKRVQLDSYTHAKSSFLGRFAESYSFGKKAYRFIKKHHKEIDVIYAWAWPLFGQKLVVKAAKQFDIKVVVHVQDVYPEPFLRKMPFFKKLSYKLLLPIDKYVLHNATKVISIAPKIGEYLCSTRNLPKGKVKIVYNWQDDKKFFKGVSVEKDKLFTFMFLGTLSAAANLEFVLRAFISADLVNARLVFAGSGSIKERLEDINSKFNANVEFMEASSENVPRLQASADVLLLPLRKGVGAHAFPSKLPAYMFSKKPILASVDLSSDVADTINKANCGWLVNSDDEKALISMFAKITILKDKELMEKGENGYKYSLKYLTRDVNLKNITDLIIQVGSKMK